MRSSGCSTHTPRPVWTVRPGREYRPDGSPFLRSSGPERSRRRPVLDLGCGTGELARAVAAAGLQATHATSRSSCCAQRFLRPPRALNVLLNAQWRRLPFSAGIFDAIVAASVLEYVDDPVTVLGECARVLSPGGLLAFTVPDPRHPIRWLESFAQDLRTAISSFYS